jgi:predicted nucleic acid-binding protein
MRCFFDTNVLVYAFDRVDVRKREAARALIEHATAEDEFLVSTQVLAEFYSTAIRRKIMGPAQARDLVRQWSEHHPVPQTADLVARGISLQQQHAMNIWDALIVEAAREARSDILYTEDLQHGRRFGDLEISNPFLSGAHEPARAKYGSRVKKKARI